MKHVSTDDLALYFELPVREHAALIQILQTYPALPPSHQRVSRELAEARVQDYQRLLDETLAEQRADNQRQLESWLAAPGRFRKSRTGIRLKLQRSDAEWLLQVLNDIRLGCWLRLGSPEITAVNPENVQPQLLPAWVAMELSGYFQMGILEALGC